MLSNFHAHFRSIALKNQTFYTYFQFFFLFLLWPEKHWTMREVVKFLKMRFFQFDAHAWLGSIPWSSTPEIVEIFNCPHRESAYRIFAPVLSLFFIRQCQRDNPSKIVFPRIKPITILIIT